MKHFDHRRNQSCSVCSFSVSSQFNLAKAAKVWPCVKWKNGFHNWILGEKSWARKNSFDCELVDFHISYFTCVWFPGISLFAYKCTVVWVQVWRYCGACCWWRSSPLWWNWIFMKNIHLNQWGAGIAQWLEYRTRDWKVAGSNPCWNSGRIFFSRVDFLCWLLFRYPFHPRVTTVARKKSRSFCQKCRWQVTAKHAYTLHMWIWLNRASALVTTCP